MLALSFRTISLVSLAATICSFLPGSDTSAQPANEPLEKFVVADGIVNALAKHGNVLYFGGTFTQVGARTGGGVPVSAVLSR